MSLGGEDIAGFLRGFGGLLQLNDGIIQGVEILGARRMPSASIASFRATSALPIPGDPDFEDGAVPMQPPPVGFGVNVIPGLDNTLLVGILLAIGGLAFALIFGEEVAREIRSRLKI